MSRPELFLNLIAIAAGLVLTWGFLSLAFMWRSLFMKLGSLIAAVGSFCWLVFDINAAYSAIFLGMLLFLPGTFFEEQYEDEVVVNTQGRAA